MIKCYIHLCYYGTIEDVKKTSSITEMEVFSELTFLSIYHIIHKEESLMALFLYVRNDIKLFLLRPGG